jgi:two-component system, LytTR family, response regulator
VELHMENRTVLHRQPLGKLEEHLDPTRFLRVHRSAIVRADQISSLAVVGDGSYLLTLRCGDAVPVSERHVQQVRAHCR